MTANQMTGYDVDTGKLVAKGLGVEACFVAPTWTEITAGQWGDRWDLAYGSGAINSDRMQRLWMTTPYRSEPQRYFVQKKSPYKKPADLAHKEIGVCDSCTVEFYLRGQLKIPGLSLKVDVKQPKVVVYAEEVPGLRDLDHGKIDAYLTAEAVGMEAIHKGEKLRPLPGAAFTMYLTGFLDKSSALSQAAFAAKVDQIVGKAAALRGPQGALAQVLRQGLRHPCGRLRRGEAAPADPVLGQRLTGRAAPGHGDLRPQPDGPTRRVVPCALDPDGGDRVRGDLLPRQGVAGVVGVCAAGRGRRRQDRRAQQLGRRPAAQPGVHRHAASGRQ